MRQPRACVGPRGSQRKENRAREWTRPAAGTSDVARRSIPDKSRLLLRRKPPVRFGQNVREILSTRPSPGANRSTESQSFPAHARARKRKHKAWLAPNGADRPARPPPPPPP